MPPDTIGAAFAKRGCDMIDDVPAVGPATVREGTLLGSGLSAPLYGGVLLLSVALFVWFGGPLWTAHGSHGMRFVVSYGAVLPLAALALALTRSFTLTRLTTAVGTIWAIKLLITAPLYYALAPGGALEDIGAIPTRHASVAPPPTSSASAPGYVAASAEVPSGAIRGQVTRGGEGVPSVIVSLDAPESGRPLGEGREVLVKLTEAGFDAASYLVTTADSLRLHNGGGRLHTARVRSAGHTRLNAPVPPGATTSPLTFDVPGQLDITCETHPAERATLVVVDHPYAVITGADGTFELSHVTAGSAVVSVIAVANGSVSRVEATTNVRAGESVELVLALDRPTHSEEQSSK